MATDPEPALDRLAALLIYVAKATDGQLGERYRKALARIIASADEAADGSRLLVDLQGNPGQDSALRLAGWLTAEAEADPDFATALGQWRHRLRAVEELADQTARRKAASAGAEPSGTAATASMRATATAALGATAAAGTGTTPTATGTKAATAGRRPRAVARSAALRWAITIAVAAAVFTLTTWLAGAVVLPLFLKDSGYRSVVATSLGVALVSVVAAWGPSFADRGEPSGGGANENTPRGTSEPGDPASAGFGSVPAGSRPVAQMSGSPRSRQLLVTGDQPTVTVGGPTWMFAVVAGLALVLAAAVSAADLVDRTGGTGGTGQTDGSGRGSGSQPGPATAAAAGPAGATIETSVLGMNMSGADYYWPGTESALNTSLERGTSLAQEPGIERIYADSAVTVTIQTESLDQILISGFRVVNVQHASSPKAGVLVYVPCSGCGGEQQVREFAVDLDASAPRIVASPSPSSGDYYYVSAGSSEEFDVALTGHAACTFDFEIDWVAAGKQHSTIVDDGGQPFRVLGDTALPWYEENDVGGGSFLVPKAAEP